MLITIGILLVAFVLMWFSGFVFPKRESNIARSETSSFVWGLFGALVGIVGFGASYSLGVGHVPSHAEEFTKRLDGEVIYQLYSSTEDGADLILLVKDMLTNNLHAIRVKGPAPSTKYFVLVNNRLVEISPPGPK